MLTSISRILVLALVLALALAFAPALARAKDTGLIFVSNEKTNNLIIIDPKTYQVVKDLKISRRPRDMHFNNDHTKLYVACGGDDTIDIIDVGRLEVVGRLVTGPPPEAFGIDEGRRRIYVSNREEPSLSVIDMDRNVIVHEVPTGAQPENVSISEDGRFVYVSSGDFIHLIDADSGSVVQNLAVGAEPNRFAVTPDGKDLWVSTKYSGEVYVIDRTKFAVAGKIEFRPPGVSETDATPVDMLMTKDGKTAYVTLGRAAQIAVVDVPTRMTRGYIPVGKRAAGLAMTRDEKMLYVANGFDDDIIDPGDGEAQQDLLRVDDPGEARRDEVQGLLPGGRDRLRHGREHVSAFLRPGLRRPVI